MDAARESHRRRLRDAAVELRTSHTPHSIKASDLADRLAGQFPDAGGSSSPDVLDAIERANGLVRLAEEVADLHRQNVIDDSTARQRLQDEHPGFSEQSYRAAYAHGMYVTR